MLYSVAPFLLLEASAMRNLNALSALLLFAACSTDIGDADDEPAIEEAESIGYNSIGYNSIGYNALTANFDSNQVMSEVPLATDSYDPVVGRSELKYALHDSLTREFMKYLVSCALEPSQYVQYKDPFTSVNYLWKGEMGYCPKWGDPASGFADSQCQEVVSACLLSRVNAFGQHIRLSQRGHDQFTTPIPMANEVPAGPTYQSGALVPGLAKKCVSGVVGPTRECSWKPSETGYCAPGAVVTVGLGAPPASSCASPPLGTSNGADTVLRVCNGITGCKQTDATYLGQNDNTCGTAFPSVTFTCPSSGFFTTMIGHHVATSTPNAPPWKPGVAGGMLGTEPDIFGYQEAAFYGNVFDADALRDDANIFVDASGEVHGRDDLMQRKQKGSIYESMFACWSPIWDDGMAYATYRVCGGPTAENCAAVPVGACGKDSVGGIYPENLCKEADDPIQAGDMDFQFCDDTSGSGTYWANAMTVFLNHPCDLIPDANVCKNIFGLTPKNW